jgi:hypothetical protein
MGDVPLSVAKETFNPCQVLDSHIDLRAATISITIVLQFVVGIECLDGAGHGERSEVVECGDGVGI